MSHDSAGGYYGAFANTHARQQCRIRPNGHMVLDHGPLQHHCGALTKRVFIVGQRRIGANEYITPDGRIGGNIHLALNAHKIPDGDMSVEDGSCSHQDVIADLCVLANQDMMTGFEPYADNDITIDDRLSPHNAIIS